MQLIEAYGSRDLIFTTTYIIPSSASQQQAHLNSRVESCILGYSPHPASNVNDHTQDMTAFLYDARHNEAVLHSSHHY